MRKVLSAISWIILGSIVGFLVTAVAVVTFLDWGTTAADQTDHVVRNRAEYVDLLLTLASVFLSAVGVVVTVGTLGIGLIALRTFSEIRENAAAAAQTAATSKIAQTVPESLRTTLMEKELVPQMLTEMAQRGELDEAVENALGRMQSDALQSGSEPDFDLEPDTNGKGSE